MLYEFQKPEMLEQFGQIQYSQYGEDVVIWHWLETLGALKKGGIYVDVGAHHPRRMSNTYLLHKIMNWRGINIEPDPNLFKSFVEERPNDINLNIGCAGVAAEMELTIYNHPAANSLHPEMIARQAQNSAMEVVDRITIPVRPLRDVLKEHLSETDQIGMLSVDAEGFDEEIIRSSDLEIWKPNIVCVEAHNFDLMDPKANSLVDYMTSQGYSLKSFVMVTLIFARN